MKPVIRIMAAAALISAVVAFKPAPAPAYMGDEGAGPAHVGKGMKQMAKELHLTPQQKQQMREIFKKHRPESGPLFKQMMTERKALRTLIHAETVDEQAIRAQSAKVAAVQADLAVQRAHIAQEIRTILTPDQIAKAQEIQARHERRMEKRMERMGKQGRDQ